MESGLQRGPRSREVSCKVLLLYILVCNRLIFIIHPDGSGSTLQSRARRPDLPVNVNERKEMIIIAIYTVAFQKKKKSLLGHLISEELGLLPGRCTRHVCHVR